jgi:hypothetical protein
MGDDDDKPERLWHYTDGAGAMGIIQNKNLRAGHLGYMNDTSEVNHAVTLSAKVAGRLLDEMPEHRDVLIRWVKYVTDSPPPSWAPNVFAVCFTTEPDLLSQWRGYATGPGGPFCLGFPFEQIDSRAKTEWSLRKCEYSRDAQEQLLEHRMRRAFERASSSFSLSPEGRLESLEYSHLRLSVFSIAPLFKHPDFVEEQEWRLYTGPINQKAGSRIEFGVRAQTLAPYVEFDLTDDGAPLEDLHWIAGPGPQQYRANMALGMVASKSGCTTYLGSPSHTPYLP